jgi:hypothetical protein
LKTKCINACLGKKTKDIDNSIIKDLNKIGVTSKELDAITELK